MGLGNIAQGVRRVSHATSSRQPAPAPAIRHVRPSQQPAFGPITRQTQPLNRAVTQARQRTARALPRRPQRSPSLPPPKPRAGTPFGRFQANEPLAPILRARTQARVNTATLSGYTGTRRQLGATGARLVPTETHSHRNVFESIGHFFAPVFGGGGSGGAATDGTRIEPGGLVGAVATPNITHSFGVRLPEDLAIATWHHPGAVVGHTATGLAEMLAGLPAGLGELGYGTASGLAHGSLTQAAQPWQHLGQSAAHDFSRRYGPLLAGNDKAFQQRVAKEGAAPELTDIASVVGGAGAVLGRAVTPLARAGRFGEAAQRIATERPLLRVSGDLAVPQDIHPNFFRAAGQRLEDKARNTRMEGRGVPVAPGVRVLRGRNVANVVKPGLQPRTGEVVQLSKPLMRKAQRVVVSRVSALSHIANKREQAVEITHGVERDLASLSHKQRRAVWHAVQGVVPLHRMDGETTDQFVARFRDWVQHRKQQIVTERQRVSTPEDPAALAPTRELQTLDFLDKHASDLLANDKLANFHASYLQRSNRTAQADPGLNNLTALVRRYRPQAHVLSIAYPYEKRKAALLAAQDEALKGVRDVGDKARIRERFGNEMQALDAQRPEMDRQFVETVRHQAQQHGLPEPAYVYHGKRPWFSRADRTAANLFRGVAASRQSDMTLFREGRADTSPQHLIQSVAKNIKRKHQWQGVATAAEQHAFKEFGHGTPEQLQSSIEHAGLNPEDFAYYNPRILHSTREATNSESAIRSSFTNSAHPGGEALKEAPAEFRSSPGAVAIPREVYNELKANTQPAGRASRVAGRVQGLQSALILGASPSWLSMQVAANTLQSLVGMGGNAKDLLAGQLFHHGLEPAQREALDVASGMGMAEGMTRMPHLGVHQGKLSAAVERFTQTPIPKVAIGGRGVRVTDVNPVHAMFAVDNLQNNAFRRAVLYNAVKRQAYRNMGRELGFAKAAQERVSGLLRLRPGEDLTAHIDRILANPQDVEKLATHVNNVLGDYLRYTSRERRLLRPTVMFYGFMRYALKTLFYTLPVDHPVAASLMAKVGQLHGEELRQLFGTRDVPPWVMSRMFLYDKKGNVRLNPQGLPESVDLARINPVTTPVTDVLQESSSHVNAKGQTVSGVDLSPLTGMVSPMIQAGLDQLYARNSFTGQGFHVHGHAEDNPSPDAVTRGRIFLGQMASMAWPYRAAMTALYGGAKQGDDTLLGSPRPIRFKTAGTQAKERQREAALPSRGRQVLESAFPLVFPRGDTTRHYIATHNKGGALGGSAGPVSPAQQALENAMAHRASAGQSLQVQQALENAMKYRR